MNSKHKLEALRNLAERPGTEAEGQAARQMLAKLTPAPLSANDITKLLLLAISEKYKPACLLFRLNVIVAAASRGGGRGGVVRSAPNGSPDLIGAVRGTPLAIEVKAGKDRLGPAQLAFRGAWLAAGGIYIVARDVDRTMEMLDAALRGRGADTATEAARGEVLRRAEAREAQMWGDGGAVMIDPTTAEGGHARWLEEFDPPLDPGIEQAVLRLRAVGVETFESCEGGTGHAYPVPTVRFHGGKGEGLRAMAAAMTLTLPVAELRRVWPIIDGEPTGPWWELTFTPTDRQEQRKSAGGAGAPPLKRSCEED